MISIKALREWEYYEERMSGGHGLQIIFHTVRLKGGNNLFRTQDEATARLAASAPALKRQLQECVDALESVYGSPVMLTQDDTLKIRAAIDNAKKLL